MPQILSAHRTRRPGFKIFLNLLADHSLGNRPQVRIAIARRERHAGAGAAFKCEKAMRSISGGELTARTLHRRRVRHSYASPSSSLKADRRLRPTPRLRTIAIASP